ncbi:MAG TPA: dihydrolipoamide acetyltransferase family protein [Steroidobacteraceae bacterium]|nr:dihydrolipoamide acetyltransferase family protein [Steroidobacteraceae bacterium]
MSAAADIPARARIEVRAPSAETEGSRSQVLRWLKSVGERVAHDEPLLELETDKVTVEVAAPAAGVLREVLKREQEEVTPGELLARIEIIEGRAADPSSAEPSPAQPREPARDASQRTAPRPAEPREAAAPLSPAVRRLLSEHGLSASAVTGSGPDGRVTVDDVLRHVERQPPERAGVPTALEQTPLAGRRLVPHSAVRRRIAEHMVRSLQSAPHVTSVFEADLGGVLAHRARHREDFAARGAPLTLTAYFALACVAAIRAVPEANARWTDDALEIYEQVHLGIGTAVEGQGLIVPVVRDAQGRGLLELARELQRLVGLARAGRLAPADVQGGTFTLSNHGVSGSLLAAPIVIHQPQVAILGIGRLEKRAVVVDEEGEERIVARPRCYVTLTIDHRAMDGNRANRFLTVLTRTLAEWPQDPDA